VKVEPSANRVRLIPYGVNGRLTWRDFGASPGLRPPDADQSPVEWIVPMTTAAATSTR
jgi:hypothetical protein